MISILEELYNGRVFPWERRVHVTEERRQREKDIERGRKYFSEKLSQDDYQRFEQLENLYIDSHSEEDADLYAYSFTLGALLMLEIIERGENIISEQEIKPREI